MAVTRCGHCAEENGKQCNAGQTLGLREDASLLEGQTLSGRQTVQCRCAGLNRTEVECRCRFGLLLKAER